MQRLTAARSLEDLTTRALVEEATLRRLDDIGGRTTVTNELTSIVWYLTKITTVALATHGHVRKNLGGTGRQVVRGHLHRGEIENVTKIGTKTGTEIEIGTGGIETDRNGNEGVNGTANGTVTMVVVGTMSEGVVDSCAVYLLKLHPASPCEAFEPPPLAPPMLLRPCRLTCTSHSLCTLNYTPRIFLRANASAKLFEDASNPAELEEERRLAARREHLEQVMGVGRQQGETGQAMKAFRTQSCEC